MEGLEPASLGRVGSNVVGRGLEGLDPDVDWKGRQLEGLDPDGVDGRIGTDFSWKGIGRVGSGCRLEGLDPDVD